ncbi:putative urea ABC transporter substrate-binding protein [Acidicapsa acidisoli]|uniref:putative urea ABC transporter substrate-binding protein n=1 Tax=Acidicapsa acidisoli TaxID=1615681 RepID=UPI0021DFE306|nr:putative urea ABC transporter substrate-binding protein [Acidicapsa acidisoli]
MPDAILTRPTAPALAPILALLLSVGFFSATPAHAAAPTFTVGWSVYAGWNPYFYMAKSGILKRWADKYGVVIKVQRFDYAASLDAFVGKNIDACTMTNMEALDMPAAAGVDSTALIVGDYSNGNDAVLARNNLTLAQLPGKRIMLVQKTVSEYLLERAMDLNGLSSQIPQLRLMNTSDSDLVGAFLGNQGNQVAVTWKPLVSQILAQGGNVKPLFDSSRIPGEILDLLVVRTDILSRPDGSGARFAKAITGAWYETLAQLAADGAASQAAISGSAAASGDSVASYKEQLRTTYLFSTPKSAVDFSESPTLKQKMDLVRQFCFRHQLLGQNIASVNDVAIRYPDGSVQGKSDRVRLRMDSTYMRMAEQGKL